MSNINIDEVLGAFSYARCDDYHSWLSVGLALYNEGYGCDVWDSWSRQSPKYRSGECAVKWATFASESSSKLGTGSLVQWAKDDSNYKPSSSQAFGFDDATSGSATAPTASHSSNSANITKTPIGELKEYLQAVFKAGDIVNFVVDSSEKDGKHIPNGKGVNKSLERLLSDCDSYDDIAYVLGDSDPIAGAWIRFNPMSGEGCKNSDVVDLRHCLIESDSLPKHEQLAKIKELNLPCSAIVDSGGKSIHAIVRIDAGKDEKLYKERVIALHAYLEQQGFPVDKSCKNQSRLSRIAGVSRNGKRQSLIATHIGASSYDQWQNEITLSSLTDSFREAGKIREINPNDKSDNILGNRFLTRFGSWLLIAQSGIGKSVMAMQMALHFTLGKSIFGIPVEKPLKVLFIQAENNDIDLARPFHSVSLKAQFSEEENALIDKNLIFACEESSSGDKFITLLDEGCKKLKPDLVIVDPLLSYIGGDISRQEVCSKFLRNQLNPIIKKHQIAMIIIHHTGKPPKDIKSNASGTSLSYLGIGSSELVNWARAVSVIQQSTDDKNIYELIHTKRASLSGADESTYMKHATDGVYWELCNAPAKVIKTPNVRKSKYDCLKLEQLKPMDKEELMKHLMDELKLAEMEHSYNDAKRVFTLAKRELIVYDEATKLWQGKYYEKAWTKIENATKEGVSDES